MPISLIDCISEGSKGDFLFHFTYRKAEVHRRTSETVKEGRSSGSSPPCLRTETTHWEARTGVPSPPPGSVGNRAGRQPGSRHTHMGITALHRTAQPYRLNPSFRLRQALSDGGRAAAVAHSQRSTQSSCRQRTGTHAFTWDRQEPIAVRSSESLKKGRHLQGRVPAHNRQTNDRGSRAGRREQTSQRRMHVVFVWCTSWICLSSCLLCEVRRSALYPAAPPRSLASKQRSVAQRPERRDSCLNACVTVRWW